MRKVVLFIATSLDGYIAGKKGEIDWLYTENIYGYDGFYAGVDTLLMGNETYKLSLTFGDFPFAGKQNFVFTRDSSGKAARHVTFISQAIPAFVRDLKSASGKNIWLVGGGQINTLLLNEDLIDEMIISVHPVILGEGIPLFGKGAEKREFRLMGTKAFESGLVQLAYERKF